MSYYEAIEDGIRTEKHGRNTIYYPLCCNCGNEVMSMSYLRAVKYTCNDCKANAYLSDKEKKTMDSIPSKELKFNNAVKRIYKVTKNKKLYDIAIDRVHNKLHKKGWFDSTEEIMVAIELVKRNIRTKHQVKMGIYKADFVLPEKKVILEVDGVIYHTDRTRQKEEIRDNLIIANLGAEWEVVRITDELINQNITRLIPAINKIIRERKKLREKNLGQLPKGYTKTAV